MTSKHMWICVAIVAVGAVVLAFTSAGAPYLLLFLVPCMLMMAGMMWMMTRGS